MTPCASDSVDDPAHVGDELARGEGVGVVGPEHDDREGRRGQAVLALERRFLRPAAVAHRGAGLRRPARALRGERGGAAPRERVGVAAVDARRVVDEPAGVEEGDRLAQPGVGAEPLLAAGDRLQEGLGLGDRVAELGEGVGPRPGRDVGLELGPSGARAARRRSAGRPARRASRPRRPWAQRAARDQQGGDPEHAGLSADGGRPHESGPRRVYCSGCRPPTLPPFQTLVEAHATDVARFLRGMVGAEAAEDALQETFLAALRAYPGFDGANPRAWLLTIARNKAIDETRKKRPEPLADVDRFAGRRRIGPARRRGPLGRGRLPGAEAAGGGRAPLRARPSLPRGRRGDGHAARRRRGAASTRD